MSRLRWLFASPVRLYGAMAAALCLMVLFMVTVIGIRVAALPEAPRSAATAEPFPDDDVEVVPDEGAAQRSPEDAALAAVPGAKTAVVRARDGLVQVVDVVHADGRTAEVVLLSDGPGFIVESVSWRTP